MAISFDATLVLVDMSSGFTTANLANEEDTAPNAHAVQRAFTSLNSGTAPAGSTYHSVSSPFTYTIERPAQYRILGPVNPVTGRLGSVPRNVYTYRTRKGVVPLAGQAPVTMVIETKVSVPAGADTADAENIRLGLAVHFAEGNDLASQLGDLAIDGIL